MKFISRKMHAVSDILLILALIAGPWLFVPGKKGVESVALLGAGIGVLAYSLMTKYELGIVRTLNFKNHLSIDLICGLFLLASPWLLNFGDRSYLPHVVMGALLILFAVTTRNQSIAVTQQEKTFTF